MKSITLMKAITLLEPWASLVKLKEKRIETRSWETSYRGPLAIHAGASCKAFHMDFAWKEPFYTALKPQHLFPGINYNLGCVIAVGELVDCLLIQEDGLYQSRKYIPGGLHDFFHAERPLPTGNEYAFGDYTPGRYAWILDNVKPLDKPVPMRGYQRLWKIDPAVLGV